VTEYCGLVASALCSALHCIQRTVSDQCFVNNLKCNKIEEKCSKNYNFGDLAGEYVRNYSCSSVVMVVNCKYVVDAAAFFSILHSWLNAFAEMLRFADRLFYKVRFTLCYVW